MNVKKLAAAKAYFCDSNAAWFVAKFDNIREARQQAAEAFGGRSHVKSVRLATAKEVADYVAIRGWDSL